MHASPTPPLLLLLLLLASLASGLLIIPRQCTSPTGCTVAGRARGFKLVASAANYTWSFSPQIHRWTLSAARTAPGVWQARLVERVPTSDWTPAWRNGSAPETGTIGFDLSPPSVPLGFVVEPRAGHLPDADYVSYVGTRYGAGTAGVGVGADGTVFVPGRTGTFVVCNQTVPLAPPWPVSWAARRGTEPQRIPDGCVPIYLIAQCETLRDLPGDDPNVSYDRDAVQVVPCSRDVELPPEQ